MATCDVCQEERGGESRQQLTCVTWERGEVQDGAIYNAARLYDSFSRAGRVNLCVFDAVIAS